MTPRARGRLRRALRRAIGALGHNSLVVEDLTGVNHHLVRRALSTVRRPSDALLRVLAGRLGLHLGRQRVRVAYWFAPGGAA
jgi:hypothetical protein